MARVQKTDECWLFDHSGRPDGYCKFMADGKQHYAHRFAYETYVGPIPEGCEIHHICRVRNCVNPAHLKAASDLVHGLLDRGTHCAKGHEMTPENSYFYSNGSRFCRACRRERLDAQGTQINTRYPTAEIAALDELAASRNLSRSALVRSIVLEHIAQTTEQEAA